MTPVRTPWSTAAFVMYAGGLTVFISAIALLATLASGHTAAAFTGLALLVFCASAILAAATLQRTRPVVAGLLALTAVLSFVVLVGALLTWAGWLSSKSSSAFGGFHLADLLLELVAVVAPLVALGIFRFPLLVFFATVATWFFVTDLISNGGTWSRWVTLFVGLTLVLVGLVAGSVYGFWVHVVAGLTVGGALLSFWHHGDFRWLLLGASALVFVGIAALLERSSYAVLGVFGLFLAFSHFVESGLGVPFVAVSFGETSRPAWERALLYTAFGLALMAIGLVIARRRGPEDA